MSRARPALCLLLSGFAGLVYEVVWIRRAALVFGSSTIATSVVVAVFFAGLAAGSHLFGRTSGGLARPMRRYAVVELGVAAFALASPLAFDLIARVYAAAYRGLGGHDALFLLARVGLVGVVLLPPTVLMGATLPLVAQHAIRRPAGIAASIGTLYGLNTLGAAAGCALCGLVLIPSIGLRGAVLLGVIGNVAAAILAWGAAAPGEAKAERPVTAARPQGPLLSALIFVTGFVAMANEVLWTRFLGLVLRNTVYTYTLTLTVVLAGIVIGSFVAALLFDRRLPLARTFGALQVLAGLYVLTLLLLPPAAWHALGPGLAIRFALFLPPAVLSGASFPLAVRLGLERAGRVGATVGTLSAVNIAGGVLGSLMAGLVGLPFLGLSVTNRLLAGLSLAAGIVAWTALAGGKRRAGAVAFAASAVALWLWIPHALRTRVPADFLRGDGVLVDMREGMTSNVAVVSTQGILQLQIDRLWQGENRRTHQIMAAYVPLALHPVPRRALVVGVGVGQTASRFLLDRIERLDCVDIEPRVFDIVRADFDAAWLSDPRVRLIGDDGRNVVTCATDRYDIISIELGQLYRPGVATFYTADFYARARARLAPGGLLCQFVPLYSLTADQFRSVVRTFLATFPHAVLWYNTAETILIGSADRPIVASPARLDTLLAEPRIHADLAWSQWGGEAEWLDRPPVFLAGMLCDERGLERLSRGAPISHDDRPALEYAAARAAIARPGERPVVDLLSQQLDPIAGVLAADAPAGLAAEAEAMRSRNFADLRARALLGMTGAFQSRGDYDGMRDLIDRALRENPGSRIAHRMMGDVLLRLDRPAEAKPHFDEALRLDPGDPLALRGLGEWCSATGRTEEAVGLFRRALAILPDDAETHYNLGSCLERLGQPAAAAVQFQRAQEVAPAHERNSAASGSR